MPIIPKIVDGLFSVQNETENAVFNARVKAALYQMELRHKPKFVARDIVPQFVVLDAKPPPKRKLDVPYEQVDYPKGSV